MPGNPWHVPVPLTAAHELAGFACGEATLDLWLKQRALRNEGRGASRTYVLCDGSQVIAYYCLAAGSIVSAVRGLRAFLPGTRLPAFADKLTQLIPAAVRDRSFGVVGANLFARLGLFRPVRICRTYVRPATWAVYRCLGKTQL